MTALLLVSILATPPDGELVRDIVVEGLVAVGREVALAGIATEVGEPFDAEVLTHDIKVLWDKQLFSDVGAHRQAMNGGWRVIFTVSECPVVRRVVFGGNDGCDDEALLGEPSALREIVEECFEIRALSGVWRELAAKLGPRVLAPGKKPQRARSEVRFHASDVEAPVRRRVTARGTGRRNQSASAASAASCASGMPPAIPTASRILASISSDNAGFSRRNSRVLSLPWPIFSPL